MSLRPVFVFVAVAAFLIAIRWCVGIEWFVFVVIVVGCALAFRSGLDWAIHGEALWPEGGKGAVRYLLCIPACTVMLFGSFWIFLFLVAGEPYAYWNLSPLVP